MTILAITQGAAAAGLTSFGVMVATRALTLHYMDREDPRGKMVMRITGSVAPFFIKVLQATKETRPQASYFHAGLLFGAIVITASLYKGDLKVVAVSLLIATLVSVV